MDFTELAVTDNRGALSSDFGLGKVGICRGLAGGPPLQWVFTDVELLTETSGAAAQAPPGFFGVTWSLLPSEVELLKVLGINLEFGEEEAVWALGCSWDLPSPTAICLTELGRGAHKRTGASALHCCSGKALRLLLNLCAPWPVLQV